MGPKRRQRQAGDFNEKQILKQRLTKILENMGRQTRMHNVTRGSRSE